MTNNAIQLDAFKELPLFEGINEFQFGARELSAAMYFITRTGLDQLICSRSGRPFGKIDSSEILLTLEADFAKEFCKADRLIDLWELRHWTMCSRPAPAFRLASPQSILAILKNVDRSEDNRVGLASLVCYLLSRADDALSAPQYFTLERFQFLRAFHQAVAGLDNSSADFAYLTTAAHLLAQADSMHSFDLPANNSWLMPFSEQLFSIIHVSSPEEVNFESLALFAYNIAQKANSYVEKRSIDSEAASPSGHKKVALAVISTAAQAERLAKSAAAIWELKLAAKAEAEEAAIRVAKSAGASIGSPEEREARLAKLAKKKSNSAKRARRLAARRAKARLNGENLSYDTATSVRSASTPESEARQAASKARRSAIRETLDSMDLSAFFNLPAGGSNK